MYFLQSYFLQYTIEILLGQTDGSFHGFQGPPQRSPQGRLQNNRPFGLYKPPGFEVSGQPKRQRPRFNGRPQQPIIGPNHGPLESTNFEPSYGPNIAQGIGPRRPIDTGMYIQYNEKNGHFINLRIFSSFLVPNLTA